MSFRNEGEIKTFSDTQKMKECVAMKPSLRERLKAGGGGWKCQIEAQIYTKSSQNVIISNCTE